MHTETPSFPHLPLPASQTREPEAALSRGGACENLGSHIRDPFQTWSDHVTPLLKTLSGLLHHSEQHPKPRSLPFPRKHTPSVLSYHTAHSARSGRLASLLSLELARLALTSRSSPLLIP